MSEEQNNDKANKTKKFRSPNYPFIGLEEAIKKADALLKSGGLHEVPFKAAMEAWGYKAGSTQQAIAALRSFGLITVTGEGDQRKVQLTESARKILKPDRPDRAELVKAAVLMPSIYGDLWRQFKGDLPPSDTILSNYLEFEKKFNPDIIKGLIKDFRASITYAKLQSSDTIVEMDEETDDLDEKPPADNNQGGSGSTKHKPPAKKDGVMYTINIDVLEDGQINVVTAGDLNEQTFALVREIFDLKAKHGARPEKTEPARNEPEPEAEG